MLNNVVHIVTTGLQRVNQLIFVMETRCVFFEVRNDCLNIT
jgi:hypothetical protein